MSQPSTGSSPHSPALYAWYLHPQMLDALFDETSRSALRRITHRYVGRGDHLAFTRELESWLRRHPVDPLDVAVLSGRCAPGRLVWSELDFEWSQVSSQRRMARAGAEVRCSFTGAMGLDDGSTMRVDGTFNPGWVTCSTANTELNGTRRQYVLGQVAEVTRLPGGAVPPAVELRPLAIATRFLDQDGEWPEPWGSVPEWQRVDPGQVDQFEGVDFTRTDPRALEIMSRTPEDVFKHGLAHILGEPTIPKTGVASSRTCGPHACGLAAAPTRRHLSSRGRHDSLR